MYTMFSSYCYWISAQRNTAYMKYLLYYQVWPTWFIQGLCIPGLNILLGCIGLLGKQFKSLKIIKYECGDYLLLTSFTSFIIICKNTWFVAREWSLVLITLISKQWKLQVINFAFHILSLLIAIWFFFVIRWRTSAWCGPWPFQSLVWTWVSSSSLQWLSLVCLNLSESTSLSLSQFFSPY